MLLKKCNEKLSWERWPFAIIYAPLFPLWFFYVLKSKALWWFTPANPTLTFAGFDGEEKKEMYDLLPEGSFPKTIYLHPRIPFWEVKRLVAEDDISYPLSVKPNVGLKGLLFRKVDDEEQLKLYHEKVTMDYLVQVLVTAPVEVSVFYYRYPYSEQGVITGFVQKEMMHVFGDGRSDLWTLISQHPLARFRLNEMRTRHEKQLHIILSAGEKYILMHAANLNRGARFTNLENHIDEQLLSQFDKLSHRTSWYYGRFDLKGNSIEEIKNGRFVILEFNGAGAEPNHVYHDGKSWMQALSVFAFHWKVLYQIARYNNKHRGVPYWTNQKGKAWMKAASRHGRLLQKLDAEILI